MSQIFVGGNVVAHIPNGTFEMAALCFDGRDDEFKTAVVIDLFSFLPNRYHQEEEPPDDPDSYRIPDWQFVIQAMQSCFEHQKELWEAWHNVKDDSML